MDLHITGPPPYTMIGYFKHFVFSFVSEKLYEWNGSLSSNQGENARYVKHVVFHAKDL